MIFRDLTSEEEVQFRAWARENYTPFSPISGVWHPVVQDECSKINLEASENEKLPEPEELLNDNSADCSEENSPAGWR